MISDVGKGSLVQGFSYWLTGLLSIILTIVYSRRRKAEKEERKKFKAFIDFLDIVSYQYTIFQSVEDAVLEAMEQMDNVLRDIIEEIYQILMQQEVNELFVYKKRSAIRIITNLLFSLILPWNMKTIRSIRNTKKIFFF